MPLFDAPDWKAELNDAQRRAVEHDAGPLIVLAGPGTGKTRVIISRLRRLIEDGAEPETLLALTFSVRAAEEMRERLGKAVGPRLAERVQARTFHSFGHSILLRFGDMLGLPQSRTFMDSAQRKRLYREIIRERRLLGAIAVNGPDAAIDRLMRFIEDCRREGKTPEDAASYAGAWEQRLEDNHDLSPAERDAEQFRLMLFRDCARGYEHVERACIERGLLSFDQCLSLPLRLLTERPVVASILRQEIRHIVFDEFQDIDPVQFALLEKIAPPRDDAGRSPDVCVVGDDDQAIYGFRGASERSFQRFAETWTDTTTIPLTVNYRSGGAIIGAANAHIARCGDRFQADKTIEAAPGSAPGCVQGVIVEDALCGSAVAAMILLDRRQNPGRRYADYAVLARTHVHVHRAAAALETYGIPVALRRKITPLQDAAVQDLMAWITLLAEPRSPGEASCVQRLLSRPPFLVPPGTLVQWAERRRAAAWESQAGGASADEALSFIDWLRSNAADDPAASSFLATLDDLHERSLTAAADVVIDHIMRRADLVHAEELTPRERAARVRNLVCVLQFVRSRQPFLEQPGDLHAFWRYYNDLSDAEKQFVAEGSERLDGECEEARIALEQAGGDAVLLLTAHSSKGLEFDTVFLLHCRPGGLPDKARAGRDDEDRLPGDFCDAQEPSQSEEQRRLFYVACTRAKRRLVMLAKSKKGRGTTADYFIELTEDSPGVTIEQFDGADLIEQAGLAAPDELDIIVDETDERRKREALVFKAASDVRRSAAELLRAAANADIAPAALANVQTGLARAATELHAIESLRQRGELPANLPPELTERLAPLVDRFRRALAPVPLTAPLQPPLKLSYSAINDYRNCPACYYVKYVLRLDEPKTAALSVGSIVHESLEKFYREWRDADADGRPRPGLERLKAIGRRLIASTILGGSTSPHELVAQVNGIFDRYFTSFHDDAAHILEIERRVVFDYPDPANPQIVHRMEARIDRIDQLPSGGVRVIDYKTGAASKKLVNPPDADLQMCIYRMALPMALQTDRDDDGIDGVAEYWMVREGVRGVLEFSAMKLDKARAAIDKAINGMLSGSFERNLKTCKGICWMIGGGDSGSAKPDGADSED